MAQDKNVVYKITVNADDATATVRRLDGTIVATQVNVQSLRKEFGNFSVQVGRSTQVAADKFNTFNQSVKSAKIEQQGLSRATGGATTSVLELGRVVSDAPYGIRGMANNISQLASNMLFTAQQVDGVTGKVIGFTGVLKQMGQVFMGPLGVLFAIQAVISAMDYFWGSTSKATEEVEKLNNEFDKTIEKINLIAKGLPDAIEPLLKSLGLSDGGLKEFTSELQDTLTILNNEFVDFKKAYENLSDKQKKDPEIISNLIKKYLELIQTRSDIVEQEEKISKYKELEKKGNTTSLLLEKEKLRELYLQKAVLEDMFKKDGAKKEPSRIKAFRQNLLNLRDEYQKYIAENKLLTERSERERLLIEQDAALKSVEIKYEEFKQKEYIRLQAFLASSKDDNAKAKAQADYDEAMILAQHNFNATTLKLKEKNSTELAEWDRTAKEKQNQLDFDYRKKQINDMIVFGDETRKLQSELNLNLQEDRISEQETLIEGLPEGSIERLNAERQLSIMRMDLSTAELEHEKMIADAKYNVQLEYVNNISSIGSILTSIAGKNKALAIAALTVQKGAAIAGVVINAQKAIAQATSNFASVPAVLPPGIPNPAYPAAAIDYGKSVATTKAQSAISIASILATTISSFSKPTGGGSGASSGGVQSQGRTFDFNLVGSTGQNQLAQTIGGQVSQPIKAYVVGSEITNQQAFDNQIQGQVTIG